MTQTQAWLQRFVAPQVTLKAHSTLFAVDPGKKHAALAYFDSGRLEKVALIREVGPLEVSLAAAQWILSVDENPDTLITEMQQVYGGIHHADPNDLLPLAEVVGGISALVPAQIRIKPKPREWKGTTNKDVFTQRTIDACDLRELELVAAIKAPKAMLHNVFDAIALGKWAINKYAN